MIYKFSQSKGLTEITIPSSVTGIGYGAFYYCVNLASVTSKIKEPFKIDPYSFYGISTNCILYIPKGTRNAYIAAGWTKVFYGGVVEQEDIDDTRERMDVNGDGDVNTADVVAVYSFIEKGEASLFTHEAADVDGDGDVNTADVVAIYAAIIGDGGAGSREFNRQMLKLLDK